MNKQLSGNENKAVEEVKTSIEVDLVALRELSETLVDLNLALENLQKGNFNA